MATPTGPPPGFNPWQATRAPSPTTASTGGENEDGVTLRPMRLKVLYTFDDQNKTNCLARWPSVLQIQTVAMDETTSIGVIELKTCIDAIVQCSPELVARLGQDYTVYAYDYSEYDNPLVGQGMLSKALSTASPTPDAPASQSRQLITGRVCKNILGLFTNGVKETLEVKLRLVPVPTMLQGEYQNTMERYREMNKSIAPGFDVNEWNSFLQSNPNLGQMAKNLSPAPLMNPNMRDGLSMEVVNQLLAPNQQQQQQQQQPMQDQFNQANFNQANYNPAGTTQPGFSPANQSSFNPVTADNSGNEGRPNSTAGEKAKKTSRPSSRVSVKRPRGKKSKAAAAMGGHTSGYEEGTDGDDGPAPKKRAKVTRTDWKSHTTMDMTPDSLRVAAGTSGSLRLFRPIAMSPHLQGGGPPGNHLVDVPRAPTPVPNLPNQPVPRDQVAQKSSLRRDSFTSQNIPPPREHISPYPPLQRPEDEVRRSIESAHPSPDRSSPADTPPEIGSSPPVMRTRPPSTMRSSPPCPSSPVLPQMPRTDSGFMSGSLDDLFGDEDERLRPVDDDLEIVSQEEFERRSAPRRIRSPLKGSGYDFVIEQEVPGPPELLPTRMPNIGHPNEVLGRAKAAIQLTGSVVSEDGQVLPPLKNNNRGPMRRTMSQPDFRPPPQQHQAQKSSLGPRPQDICPPVPDLQHTHPHHSMSQPPPEIPHPTQNGTSQPPTDIQYPMQNEALQPQPESKQQSPPQQVISHPTPPVSAPTPLPPPAQEVRASEPVPAQVQEHMQFPESVPLPAPAPAPRSRPTSRSGMKVRTASMGSLTLPNIPASDPVLPPSSLQRSQTWTEAPHPASEAPMQPVHFMHQPPPGMNFARPPPNANGVPYSRTLQSKKASIRQKLEQAIANGQMPPFCANCGAIDTPTWRKAWSQDLDGIPGYYEYSDEPGCVTTIIILERDSEGKPTKHKLIKKFLGPKEKQEDFDEFLLCNPCGIWMSKYKTQRPEERWESNGPQERSRGDKRRSTQRPSRAKKPQVALPTSEAYFPQSDFPVSDAYFPQSEAPGPHEGISPGDMTGMQQQASAMEQAQRQRSTSAQPKKRLNAMTSDAASAALRRAIQSSPARWVGTQHSPIEVDDELGSTRRLLFPSPRKDGSPKVLGEVVANVVQIATDFRSPKQNMVEGEAQNKENCPPAIDENDISADLLQLFEEEMAKGDDIERPSTPVQKSPAPNPFKTPTRPTPNHRPITRSVSRSIRSVRSAKSPGQLLMFQRTPSRTPGTGNRRRSPRNHDSAFESPFTATLNQMMSEANNQNSPSRSQGMELDFGNLPDLPNIGHSNHNVELNFSLEEFFSTDVPMPSSPPRMFNLYEDPAIGNVNMNQIDWEEFGRFDSKALQHGEGSVVIKAESEASPQKYGEHKQAGEDGETVEQQSR